MQWIVGGDECGHEYLTLKWGDKHGPEYANRLYAGVRRHLVADFRFLCVADDAEASRLPIEL